MGQHEHSHHEPDHGPGHESDHGPDHHGDPCVALVPIFQRLTREQQLEVASFARPVHVERGGFVARAQDAATQLFVVHEGRVKVSRTTPDGREATLRILGPGDVTGETGFLTGERPDSDFVALEDSSMCTFDHAVLADLLRRYPDIGVALLRSLAERVEYAERRLAARSLADVGARVAAYLLDLPGEWGADRRATVRLPVAKKELATYLGTTPETLSRRLTDLEHDGLIEVDGPDITIADPAGLDRRAREA